MVEQQKQLQQQNTFLFLNSSTFYTILLYGWTHGIQRKSSEKESCTKMLKKRRNCLIERLYK